MSEYHLGTREAMHLQAYVLLQICCIALAMRLQVIKSASASTGMQISAHLTYHHCQS